MHHNDITVNIRNGSTLNNYALFDLLHPTPCSVPVPKLKLKEDIAINIENHRCLMDKLHAVCARIKPLVDARCEKVSGVNLVATVCNHVEQLSAQEKLPELNNEVKETYANVFRPIPHVNDMLDMVCCKISLKDAFQLITTYSYSCPCKYKEAWSILIQQHLDTGCIQPSSSTHASPAFLVPKADKLVLPHWVNDHHQLNSNTVTDSYPLPCVDDILADAGHGKIWSKINMTDSFFHTKMDPESIHLTAVMTPLGLYEWTVMPQGLCNGPAIHQHCVTMALQKFIGHICHIYLDDIIIWSDDLEEHKKHIKIIMDTLASVRLYCNPQKVSFFLTELKFLGHRISREGIKVCFSKAKKILNWLMPKTATEMRQFLGLVQYITLHL